LKINDEREIDKLLAGRTTNLTEEQKNLVRKEFDHIIEYIFHPDPNTIVDCNICGERIIKVIIRSKWDQLCHECLYDVKNLIGTDKKVDDVDIK
jgi:hypothetical protein